MTLTRGTFELACGNQHEFMGFVPTGRDVGYRILQPRFFLPVLVAVARLTGIFVVLVCMIKEVIDLRVLRSLHRELAINIAKYRIRNHLRRVPNV